MGTGLYLRRATVILLEQKKHRDSMQAHLLCFPLTYHPQSWILQGKPPLPRAEGLQRSLLKSTRDGNGTAGQIHLLPACAAGAALPSGHRGRRPGFPCRQGTARRHPAGRQEVTPSPGSPPAHALPEHPQAGSATGQPASADHKHSPARAGRLQHHENVRISPTATEKASPSTCLGEGARCCSLSSCCVRISSSMCWA